MKRRAVLFLSLLSLSASVLAGCAASLGPEAPPRAPESEGPAAGTPPAPGVVPILKMTF
jgi:hypothetical protein